MTSFRIITFTFLLCASYFCYAQCESNIIVVLQNKLGGFFPNQKVSLISKVDGKEFFSKSDARGEANIKVACKEMFDLVIANYPKNVEIESGGSGSSRYAFTYSPTMVEDQKKLAMTQQQKTALDNFFTTLPDTTFMKTSIMDPPKTQPDYYAMTIISLKDLNGKVLVSENITITGRKRGKSFKGTTDKNGRIILYLPKGDTYDLAFQYHKNYASKDFEYTLGTTSANLGYAYLGTKEVVRRRKEEEARIAEEERLAKAEKEAFEKLCNALGLSLEDCYRKEREKALMQKLQNADTVVTHVLNRNRWTDKLIVCDVTGSMDDFTAQLLWWFRLNMLKEKNLQVVLFNDGDNIDEQFKTLGNTGGIHYIKPGSFEELDKFMSHVQALGYGGELPENNMEALIKGVKLSQPFKELIMIADNRSPVRDIRLLSNFTTPVHIIVCGSRDGYISPDYLNIAWRTKGTVHTMEQDITTLARMSEGQSITINGVTYRIMGGEFVNIN